MELGGTIAGTGFLDCFGRNAQHLAPVPVTFEPDRCLYYPRKSAEVPEKSSGFDFGLMPVHNIEVQALLANGVRFVNQRNWSNAPLRQYQLFKICGFPESSIVEGDGNTGIRPVILGVEQLDEHEGKSDWFFGKIHDDAKIENIVGVSGGPVCGFLKDENDRDGCIMSLRYKAIGTQRRE